MLLMNKLMQLSVPKQNNSWSNGENIESSLERPDTVRLVLPGYKKPKNVTTLKTALYTIPDMLLIFLNVCFIPN